MIIINDNRLKNNYINKYNLNSIIHTDIKRDLQLFSFEKYEHICTQNQSLNYIFFFVKGKARVYSTLSNGKSLLLGFYSPLQILGDLEFIKSENDQPSNVQVLEESFCLGLGIDVAKEKLGNDIGFLRFICGTLGDKLETISTNSSINLLYKLDHRLATYIKATLVKECGGQLIFEENLTHLSELLGTSYRHLLRTLSGFCEAGILEKGEGIYKVVSMTKLELLVVDLYK